MKAVIQDIRQPTYRKCPLVLFVSLSLLILIPGQIQAQDRTFPYSLRKQDIPALALGLVMSEYAESLPGKLDPITLEEISSLKRSDVNGFDRCATRTYSFKWRERSDEYRDTLLSATILLMGAETLRNKLSDTAVLATMLAEVYLLVKGTTYLTKVLVRRKRPFVYNTSFSVTDRYNMSLGEDNDVLVSFFSGHSAAAFALATFSSKVFMDIHGRSVWSSLFWGSSLTVAGLTAYARVKGGVHFPSDVIVGAVVGGAIGYLVPELHRKDSRYRLSFIPGPDRCSLQLRMNLAPGF